MKEIIVHPGVRTEVKETAIPRPDAQQVVIKVIVSGTNPKDWKVWHPRERIAVKNGLFEYSVTRIFARIINKPR